MTTPHKLPLLMVDVVLLALVDGALHVGLARRANPDEPFFGAWTLPGGFVRPEEDLNAEDTARRVLRDKAGVASPYLEQLYTFADATRDARGWSASIVYYALVPAHVAPAGNAAFRWEPVDAVRALPFDHGRILATALERVRSKTSYSALPLYLAPAEVTMSQLRAIYEQVLGGTLEPRGFERRMVEMDILEPTGRLQSAGGKPAKVYRQVSGRGSAQLGPSLLPR
ncbi:NUDIX domain-containing protein [Pseudorhodoferax sp. LjRoot39]|uniref:NUDIX hydrolase n=1 Tax=Pseudorhodoferax sp. LjRoot39 TaxID=3342328 RepID=UPI003ECD86B2